MREDDARTGDEQSLDRLVPQVYPELRAIAHRELARRARGALRGGTLSTTALVNEAYLKLAANQNSEWADRAHFLAVASLAMRHILVDWAKARVTQKRGGAAAPVTLEDHMVASDDDPALLLDIDDALTRLSVIHPRLARVVECRFFGGMSEEEVADGLGLTVRSVQRDWKKARMLLRRALDASVL